MNEVDERLLTSLDVGLDWSAVLKSGTGTDVSRVFDIRVIEVNDGNCDHESCYETHDIYVILEIGESYFRKSGTVNSVGGNWWGVNLQEVQVKQVTKRLWEVAP